MLKDEFCTSEPPRCVILRGALWRLAFPECNRDATDDGISTEGRFYNRDKLQKSTEPYLLILFKGVLPQGNLAAYT